MFIILLVPIGLPLLLAVSALFRAASWVRRFSGVVSSAVILSSGLGAVLLGRGAAPLSSVGILRADALSAYMLAVVGAVGLVATWGGLTPREDEASARSEAGGAPRGMYAALVCVFLSAMSLAVLADNLGVMWVAIEATTIATAFLVGHNRTRRSLEAAWKYVILAPAGVAVAFLGIVLIYASSTGTAAPTLSWVALTQLHLDLDPALVKVGAALAVLGFATKAGLAPMHSWLPDAHSQAPAPVSALMSGVLLSVSLYSILRIQAIANVVIGPEFLRALLVAGGILSLAIAAALLLRQRDYKRMLAYSSIEHMGFMALGAAVGPTALPAVLLYILSHGLIKATLFILAGRLLTAEGTPIIADMRNLLARRPGLAVPWLIGIVALVGFPPFGIFFSEVGIVLAGWAAGMGVFMAVALALMLVVFASMIRLTVGMMFGSADQPNPLEPIPPDRSPHGPLTPLLLALGVSAIIPFVSGPIGSLLSDATVALSRTR